MELFFKFLPSSTPLSTQKNHSSSQPKKQKPGLGLSFLLPLFKGKANAQIRPGNSTPPSSPPAINARCWWFFVSSKLRATKTLTNTEPKDIENKSCKVCSSSLPLRGWTLQQCTNLLSTRGLISSEKRDQVKKTTVYKIKAVYTPCSSPGSKSNPMWNASIAQLYNLQLIS